MSPFTDPPEPQPDDDRVRLMHWDSRWRQEFEQTRSGVLQCGDGRIVEVLHVGATSVPGMVARPIIDFVAVVGDPVDLDDSCLLIEGLNFIPVPVPAWASQHRGILRTLQKPRNGNPSHFAWVTTQGSPVTAAMIDLRDTLRNDSVAAMHLESQKVKTWKQCGGDIQAYQSNMATVYSNRE